MSVGVWAGVRVYLCACKRIYVMNLKTENKTKMAVQNVVLKRKIK